VRFSLGICNLKPERKRSLGRPRSRLEDNIKTYSMEIGWEGVYWMHLAHDRDKWRTAVITLMNLQSSVKGEECLGSLSFYQLHKDSAPWWN
jgi:hypothetical protein